MSATTSTTPWGMILLVMGGIAACGLVVWFCFALAAAENARPTVIERGTECVDAGGSWHWENDWVGYVCEMEGAEQ